MALTPPAQFFCYVVRELISKKLFPPKYRRETFLLSDGGTMGIDWNDGLSVNDDGNKPILLLFPGLSGGNDNLYLTSLMNRLSREFTVGVVLLRGACGLPMTSGKLSCLTSADDAKEAIDFVYSKHVSKTGGGRVTRLYAYGCSMGANILGLYLIQQGDKAKIDGAIMYGTPWNTDKSSKYFHENYGGVFSYAVSVNTCNIMKDQYKQMKKYLHKEEVERVDRALAIDAKSFLPVDSVYAFTRIMGHENLEVYYKEASVGEKIAKIKVPTFALSAMDDILCDPRVIPFDAAESAGSNVMICTTAIGNHVCHFSGANSDCWGEQWFTEPCKMFLDFLEHKAVSKVC